MEVVGIVHRRLQRVFKPRRDVQAGAQQLQCWGVTTNADKTAVLRSTLFFACTATVGVLFWHLYPGEGKTWMQAVYMSVITLSTVGFGAFNATTEAGKVFGAFWMLIGVASLGALVGSFVEFMLKQKAVEKHNENSHLDVQEFQRVLDACIGKKSKIEQVDFLKMGLMLAAGANENEQARMGRRIERIERRFE